VNVWSKIALEPARETMSVAGRARRRAWSAVVLSCHARTCRREILSRIVVVRNANEERVSEEAQHRDRSDPRLSLKIMKIDQLLCSIRQIW